MTDPTAPRRQKPQRPPLDRAMLESLALHYAARYATTRAKLLRYLGTKLRERGWDGDTPPDIEALADRLADLRYVDDAAFAAARGGALSRRGYGPCRIAQALSAAGVEAHDRGDALDTAKAESWTAAERYARRRRIGPFATEPAPRDVREKQIAAFLRAGHDIATARAWIDAAPGAPPPTPEEQQARKDGGRR